MKKVILAVDSFKGCLSSIEIEKEIKKTLQELVPDVVVEMIPVADGGEGTLSVAATAMHAVYKECMAHDPCMEVMKGRYAVVESERLALIEMAAVSGLPLVPYDRRNPMLTTSYGTGELIGHALDHGCTNFIVGIGGSATNDAGLGMLQALGYRFYDSYGRQLGLGGSIMQQVESWNADYRHPMLDEAKFTVACDVVSPFYGRQGAACVFAPQKGADNFMVEHLDKGMQHLAQLIKRKLNIDLQSVPGSGAAGGMGGGMIAFLGAELKSGGELLLQLNGFEKKLEGADLVITGEGKMDGQTLMGKIPAKVMLMSARHGVKVVGIAGRVEQSDRLLAAGFNKLLAITPPEMSLDMAMREEVAKCHLHNAIRKLCDDALR